jgi:hypothetical protein
VQNTSYKFIYNSSYNEFVAHDATNYEQFISTYSVIPVPQLTNPQIPQPSGSNTTTVPTPSTPVNPMANLYEPIQSIRPQTSDPRSRLSRTNIGLLHQSVTVAIGESTGLNDLSLNPETLVQRLIANSTWTNRDLGLLILSINGIIQVEIPNPLDEISDNLEQSETE